MLHVSLFSLCAYCFFPVTYHTLIYGRDVALDQPASPRHSLPLIQDKSEKAVIYQWNNSFLVQTTKRCMMSWHEIETSSELSCSAGQQKSAVGGWKSQLLKPFGLTFNFNLDCIFTHTRKVRVEDEKQKKVLPEHLQSAFQQWKQWQGCHHCLQIHLQFPHKPS